MKKYISDIISKRKDNVGKFGGFLIFQIKLWGHCAKLLKKNKSGQQSAALAFHTIFGIVPLTIVMLMIFHGLSSSTVEIADNVKNFIYDQLHLSHIEYTTLNDAGQKVTVMLTEHLDNIVSGFFSGLSKGSVTVFMVVLMIWAAFNLLSTIERAFNNIWHIGRGRNFLHRLINYWAILTLGPFLLGLGIYSTTKFHIISQFQATVVSHIAPEVINFLIAAVGFFLLYYVLPNTKVSVKYAIWGALAGAFLWLIMKIVFAYAVNEWRPYGTVYGALSLIPLGVMWIFITWLIILFGLQLTFVSQHLDKLDAEEIAKARSREENFIVDELSVISIVRLVTEDFEKRKAPAEVSLISSKMNMPADFTEKILNHLVKEGILIKASDPKSGYMPAQDPENITLDEISEAVSKASFCRNLPYDNEYIKQIQIKLREVLREYNLKKII